MALTIAAPTDGIIQLGLNLPYVNGQCVAAVPLPSGVSVAAPTNGVLPILGAVVLGQVVDGAFVQPLT